MKIVAKYDSFNRRRYSNPWIARVKQDGRFDFNNVGGYTGAYDMGEAGELYVTSPVEGAVYAYGQKDYRGKSGGYEYVKFVNGEFVPVAKNELIEALKN